MEEGGGEESGGEEGGKGGGGGETVEEGQEEAMEIEVAKEKEEAASEQGEGSVYFFLNQGSIGTKYSILYFVSHAKRLNAIAQSVFAFCV